MGLKAESINRDQWRVFYGKRYLGYIWRCIVKGETIFFVGKEGQAPERATVCRSLEMALEHMEQIATAVTAPNADDVDVLEHVASSPGDRARETGSRQMGRRLESCFARAGVAGAVGTRRDQMKVSSLTIVGSRLLPLLRESNRAVEPAVGAKRCPGRAPRRRSRILHRGMRRSPVLDALAARRVWLQPRGRWS
jgi:hypothetical protein